MISVNQLTRDYGEGRGIFNLSLEVKQGEVFGYLGPNGAGKTTTIRHLMGFLKPKKGQCVIDGLDCFKQAAAIKEFLGYLPGEIAFFDSMSGVEFLNFMAEMRGMKDRAKMEKLIAFFDLNPKGKIRKMSKGTKQKLGLVSAFMHDPEVLILDEPTSGLDPLMQNRFIRLILNEKKRGTTILMSSHSFEEVERTCDRVGIIRAGELVALDSVASLKAERHKIYRVSFASEAEAADFSRHAGGTRQMKEHPQVVEVRIAGSMDAFLKMLTAYHVTDMDTVSQDLEDIFMQYYGGKHHA
ncbi:ABC transporter ATP-binding protein [Eubacterium sp. 1001713B170207_170306_E7]|uniref:ABC transporter ATP-binding protein n=1 Tax=Eubacterium sp. 1001713B170207_170306_E7 TaxID=2787097 RepID=UPI001A9BD4E2|nr:ABC transporter ATP-binding protein [Eubacterium sp. 1001713B170207_170306_E7]